MPLIAQWLEDYWENHVSEGSNLVKMDALIRELVDTLLTVGDDQLALLRERPIVSPVTGKPLMSYETVRTNSHYRPHRIVAHERQVNSVMMAIKPGYCNVCCQKFNKDQIIKYILSIKNKDVHSASDVEPKEKVKSNDNAMSPRFDKVRPVEKVAEWGESSLENSLHESHLFRKEEVQNLSEYVRIYPSDPGVLLEQFREKYFAEESDATIEVEVSEKGSSRELDSEGDSKQGKKLKDDNSANTSRLSTMR